VGVCLHAYLVSLQTNSSIQIATLSVPVANAYADSVGIFHFPGGGGHPASAHPSAADAEHRQYHGELRVFIGVSS